MARNKRYNVCVYRAAARLLETGSAEDRLAIRCRDFADLVKNYRTLKQPIVIDADDLAEIAALATEIMRRVSRVERAAA